MAQNLDLRKVLFPVISGLVITVAIIFYAFNTKAPDIDIDADTHSSEQSEMESTSKELAKPEFIYLAFEKSYMKVATQTGSIPKDLKITKTHGNTKSDKPNPTIVYEIYRIGGKRGYETMKYGISSRNNYKTKPGNARPQSQARRANRLKGFVVDVPYKWGLCNNNAKGYGYRILTVAPTRNAALDLEYALVEAYYYSHGNQYPPWQILPKVN